MVRRLGTWVVAGLVLSLLVLSLTACDNRECLHGHIITTTTVVPVGKTVMPVTSTTYVCDEYAPEQPK